MPTFQQILEHGWYPDVPRYEGGTFISGIPDTPNYIKESQTVYGLQDRLYNVNNLPESHIKNDRQVALIRAKELIEQGIIVPIISLREFLQLLLEAFSTLLRSKGLDRIADIALLQFNLEAFLATLLSKFKEFWDASIRLSTSSKISEELLAGSGIQLNQLLFDLDAIPGEFKNTYMTSRWVDNSPLQTAWRGFDKEYPSPLEVSLIAKISPIVSNSTANIKDLILRALQLARSPHFYEAEKTAVVGFFKMALNCFLAIERQKRYLFQGLNLASNLKFEPIISSFKRAQELINSPIFNGSGYIGEFASLSSSIKHIWENSLKTEIIENLVKIKNVSGIDFEDMPISESISVPGFFRHGKGTRYDKMDYFIAYEDPIYYYTQLGGTPTILSWLTSCVYDVADRIYTYRNASSRSNDKIHGVINPMLNTIGFFLNVSKNGGANYHLWADLLFHSVNGSTSIDLLLSRIFNRNVQINMNQPAIGVVNELRGIVAELKTLIPNYNFMDYVTQFNDDQGVTLFALLLEALSDVVNQRDTNLGRKLPYYINVRNIPVVNVYLKLLEIYEDFYSLQTEQKYIPGSKTRGNSITINGKENRAFRSALRCLLYKEDIPTGRVYFSSGLNINDRRAVRSNYHNLFFINEAYLCSQEWMAEHYLGYFFNNFSLDNLTSALEALLKVERDYENEFSNRNGKIGLMRRIQDGWQRLSSIVKDEMPFYYKQASPWHERKHLSGNQLAVLKEAHDKFKGSFYHAAKDIDAAISIEEGFTFTAKQWVPFVDINTEDRIFYKGAYLRPRKNFYTTYDNRPDPSLNNYSTHWESGSWNNSRYFPANEVVLHDGVFYVSVLPSKGTPPSGYNSNEFWKNISPVPGQSFKKDDHFILHKETNQPFDPWYTSNTNNVVYTAKSSGTMPNSHHDINNFLMLDSAVWDIDRSNSFTIGHRSNGGFSPVIGKWSINSDHWARWRKLRNPVDSRINQNLAAQFGYWNYPSGVLSESDRQYYKNSLCLPLSMNSYITNPWIRKQSNDDNFIGGHLVGDEKSKSSLFYLYTRHTGSGHSLLGMSILQGLEMVFYSHSIHYSGIDTISLIGTPAQFAAFGFMPDVGSRPGGIALKYIPYGVYLTNFRYELESFGYAPSNDVHVIGLGAVMRQASIPAMDYARTLAKQIKFFNLEVQEYRSAVRAECLRFVRTALLRQSKFLREVTSFGSMEVAPASHEEMQLLKRLIALLIAIIVSVLLSDERLSGALTGSGSGINFDSSFLDSVFFEERTAQIIIQRAVDLARSFLERKLNPNSFHEEAVIRTLVIDLQFFRDDKALQKRTNESFRNEENYRYQIIDQRG